MKGPNANPMRMFRVSALGETLLMNLHLRPSISKVKESEVKFSADKFFIFFQQLVYTDFFTLNNA